MKRRDVVVLQVHLDEGLPVVVAAMDFDPVELVAVEIELRGHRHPGQVDRRRPRSAEQQAMPVLERRPPQVQARITLERRCAEQLAAPIIRPAVQRADDVAQPARAFEHDRLAMAADVGHLVEAVFAMHQQAGMIAPFQRTVVMEFWYHQPMPDIAGTGIEDEALLQFEDPIVEVPRNGQLRSRWSDLELGSDVGHPRTS